MTTIKKNGAITFVAQLTAFIIGFAIQIILARVLGPADRGIYAILALIPAVLVTFSSLGIEIANIYFAANKKFQLKDIIANSLISGMALGLIILLLFWVLSAMPWLQEYLREKSISFTYLWIALISIPFLLLQAFLSRVLLGREEILKFNAISIAQNLVQAILIVVLLIGFSGGLKGAVLSFTVTAAIVAVLALFYTGKLSKISFSFNRKLFSKSIRYGGVGYLGNAAQYLGYRVDTLLVLYFLNGAAVGYYAIAVGIAERLWMIPTSLATVLFPRISAIDDTQANELTPKVARHTFFIVFALSLALVVLGKPLIVLLFTAKFLPSVAPLLLLLPGVVALGLSKVISSDLSGRGRPVFGMVSSFVSLAINIPLNLVLIPRWGISGAAFTSSVSYSVAAVLMLIAFVRLTRTPWTDILFIKASDFKVYLDVIPKIKQRLRGQES